MKNIKKAFVLDYEKWICGGGNDIGSIGNFPIGHGRGRTKLLNKEGFMCCLGQFSLQCGATREDITEILSPGHVKIELEYLNRYVPPLNTEFSKKAMGLNDDESTNIVEKIIELQDLCEQNNFSLQVTNLPKNIEDEIRRIKNGRLYKNT